MAETGNQRDLTKGEKTKYRRAIPLPVTLRYFLNVEIFMKNLHPFWCFARLISRST